MFFIEVMAILILILVLSKHSFCPRILEQELLVFYDKENVWIELILEQGLLLFYDKEHVFYRNNSDPYSDVISIQNILFVMEYYKRDYYSRTKRIFCIEIISE